MKFAKISENSNRNFGKRKPLKRSNFKGFGWRSRWDSNQELSSNTIRIFSPFSGPRAIQ